VLGGYCKKKLERDGISLVEGFQRGAPWKKKKPEGKTRSKNKGRNDIKRIGMNKKQHVDEENYMHGLLIG